MSFGNASFKLLVSILLLTGCASTPINVGDLYVKYERYDNRVGVCLDQTRESDHSFPYSEWLSSLDKESQKQVITYLSSLTMDNCSAEEKEAFILALKNESEDAQKIISKSLYLDIPTKPKPKGIDEAQLDNLASQISSPFNPFSVFEALQNDQ
ncbi:hypothetical protein L9W80_18560 [Vibrio aestuarianus]|uniref:hypothetical protein n=1 Tax=Vibrio aestuarianus TaxID=28171 RepID=UPI00237C9FA1|nr:hypothetical protein [Vibrio aestuarianus]MDE1352140.1 hypothetical protein [Vibrio aestuarianus]